MSGRPLVEVAVDSVASAQIAAELGADRLELCQALEVGGLTPSRGLVEAVRAAVDLPVFVMIRPRPGSFAWDRSELEVMFRDIGLVWDLGVTGVVGGALTADGEVDGEAVRQFVDLAESMSFTFHRAFDLAADQLRGLDQLRRLGVSRVLTAGGRGTAFAGRRRLAEYVALSAGGPTVVAGGGIQGSEVAELVAETGVREIHLAGVASVPSAEPTFGQTTRPDEARVREVVTAVGLLGSPR